MLIGLTYQGMRSLYMHMLGKGENVPPGFVFKDMTKITWKKVLSIIDSLRIILLALFFVTIFRL